MKEIPRYWPLLAILTETGRVQSYRRLLYLAYLLDREAVLDYLFLSPPCLESPEIRADVGRLASRGLINMEFHKVWVLGITGKGRNSFAKIKEHLPKKWLRSLKRLVQERGDVSYLQQLEHLSIGFPNPRSISLREKHLAQDITGLLEQLERFPPSRNLLMLEGSLDHLLSAEKKARRRPKRKLLLAAFSCYVSQIQRIYNLVAESAEILGEMDLCDLAEEFKLLEDACSETVSLPPVEERHDLSLFAEV